MAPSSGYSGTPLIKKLGFQPSARIKTKNQPANYLDLLGSLPDDLVISARLKPPVNWWHLFVTSRAELEQLLPLSMNEIEPAGGIWVSWPKKASKVATDVTEDTIRDVALPLGLVDIKVCAIDEIWSGLKLVIRRKNRPQPTSRE